MNIKSSCYYDYHQFKDDKDSICNRFNPNPIYSQKLFESVQSIKKLDKYQSLTKKEITTLYENFVTNTFSKYNGDLYYLIITMLRCLEKLIIDSYQTNYYIDFEIFVKLWNQYELKEDLVTKYKVQHKSINILKKVFKNHKEYLNESLLQDIYLIHQYNRDNNIYQNIKTFFNKNKINYFNIDPFNSQNESKQVEIQQDKVDEWEQVSTNKKGNKNKSKQHTSKQNTSSNQNSSQTPSVKLNNEIKENLILDQELETIINDSSNYSYNYDILIEPYQINKDLIETDLDFIEDVCTEPDDDYSDYSNDEENYN
jgi:hypothetical protein